MKPDQLLSAIDQLRDDLAEARRWVRTNLRRAAASALTDRLRQNLHAGWIAVQVSPYVLEAYIDGALYEMAALRGRIERGMGVGE